MQFSTIDKNGIHIGIVEAIEATPPDVGFYAPAGVLVASTPPPTDEPGKWRWVNSSWKEIDMLDLIEIFTAQVQARLDNFAKSEGRIYDNILSACSYATSTNPKFKLEGQYCVEARDKTWEASNDVMNDVMAGKRGIPTWEELAAELPELVWPEVQNA